MKCVILQVLFFEVFLLNLISAGFLSYFFKKICLPDECTWNCHRVPWKAEMGQICEPLECYVPCLKEIKGICEEECEKAECEIIYTGDSCSLFDCPLKYVCKTPINPLCMPKCRDPKCDFFCTKGQYPGDECELICENKSCDPDLNCCECRKLDPKEDFLKDRCCKCNQFGSYQTNYKKYRTNKLI